MKVILQQDIPKKGRSGDVINVADGYARNYLFPRNYAVPATGGAMKAHQARVEHQKSRSSGLLQAAQASAAKISGTTLIFMANVGAGGRLFGSITAQDVADKIKGETGVEVDKRRVGLADPIKSMGEYTVPVRLHNDVSVDMRVLVTTPEDLERRRVQEEAAARAEAERAATAAATAETTAEADTGESADGAEAQSAGE